MRRLLNCRGFSESQIPLSDLPLQDASRGRELRCLTPSALFPSGTFGGHLPHFKERKWGRAKNEYSFMQNILPLQIRHLIIYPHPKFPCRIWGGTGRGHFKRWLSRRRCSSAVVSKPHQLYSCSLWFRYAPTCTGLLNQRVAPTSSPPPRTRPCNNTADRRTRRVSALL